MYPYRMVAWRTAATTKVREAIRAVKADGWYLDRQTGSHRQYKHPIKPGLVTILGKPSEDLAPGTLQSIEKQFGSRIRKQEKGTPMETRRYAIILEVTNTGYSVYAPDVPGCVDTGATYDESVQEMRDALAFHLEGLALSGYPLPDSSSRAVEVDVELPIAATA